MDIRRPHKLEVEKMSYGMLIDALTLLEEKLALETVPLKKCLWHVQTALVHMELLKRESKYGKVH